MSSSPPTDPPPTARWRDPAGWSLRARLIAAMIALLAIVCLVVGVTAELVIRNALYDQVNTRVTEVARRTPPIFGVVPADAEFWPPGRPRPGPKARERQTSDFVRGLEPGTVVALVAGGVVVDGAVIEAEDDALVPKSLTAGEASVLAGVAAGTVLHTYELGDRGDYRLFAQTMTDGSVVVTGLPLSGIQDTLVLVAMVVAGLSVVTLVAAGYAGAVIVRRSLRPLSRVAATATRVSELRLHRGEVELAQRVPESDTDPRTEVGKVGAALNRMLDHVGHALEARHASEMQVRQFVADASHELRTPLAAIRGYAELSRRSRSPVPDEVAHVLRRVESEAQRMTTLVEDLLLLARLDAGRPLDREPVDLTMLVVDAVSDAHAAGPGHDWQLDLPEEPVVVTGDQARLHQVLGNLLANARTHTPEGTTVTVAVQADEDEAVLRVVDGGPGIPADLQPHIFERFARGDSSRSRAAGSTGLGLSIVYAVVAAHGGTVSVDSVPGRTAFTVRLPGAPRSADRPDAVHQHVAEVVQ